MQPGLQLPRVEVMVFAVGLNHPDRHPLPLVDAEVTECFHDDAALVSVGVCHDTPPAHELCHQLYSRVLVSAQVCAHEEKREGGTGVCLPKAFTPPVVSLSAT